MPLFFTRREFWLRGATVSFLVASGVRLAWIVRVQSPLTAVTSDMAGYVTRATMLLGGTTPADPRLLAFFPWGTHTLLALEFLLLGRSSTIAIGCVHALVGAIPAACIAAIARGVVPDRAFALACGLAVALWPPLLAYTGFFSSEMWFASLISLAAWLAVREPASRTTRLSLGFVSAAAFAVRPQFLLTWVLLVAAVAPPELRRRSARGVLSLLPCALPFVAVVAASAVRLNTLAGHWGLISENGAVMRVFAETDVRKIDASWRAPSGEACELWCNPPSRPVERESDVVHFDGYIGDETILARIRDGRLRGWSATRRLSRAAENLALLFVRNLPWPEEDFAGQGTRARIGRLSAKAMTLLVLPLALLGLAFAPASLARFVALANLTTLVVAAALYLGEARYRVPYDPFFLLFAIAGARAVGLRITARGRTQGASKGDPGRASAEILDAEEDCSTIDVLLAANL